MLVFEVYGSSAAGAAERCRSAEGSGNDTVLQSEAAQTPPPTQAEPMNCSHL
jgi:hypothetical protein